MASAPFFSRRTWKRKKSAMVPVGPSRTILIIEDNADAADSLARLLRLQGHRVDGARGVGAGGRGAGGRAAAIATQPGVILLDIGMPGLNGYDVASRLRARGDFD